MHRALPLLLCDEVGRPDDPKVDRPAFAERPAVADDPEPSDRVLAVADSGVDRGLRPGSEEVKDCDISAS